MLQSELESCKELQELEPENKCEAPFPETLLLSGGLFPGRTGEEGRGLGRAGRVSRGWEQRRVLERWPFSAISAGCLLTIILLMRALDPLLYEKETLQYFQTLKASDRPSGRGEGASPWAGERQLM